MTPMLPRFVRAAAHRRSSALGIGLMALVLAGCVPTTTVPYGIDLGDYEAAPRDLIAVDSITDDHLVRFAGRGGSVGPVERERLAAFIGKIAGNHPESLRVAVHGRVTARQRNLLRTLLAADGVDPQSVRWAGWHKGPAVRPGTVVVSADRAIAVKPLCPGAFGHPSAPNDNRPEPGLGCANTAALAAMIADPHDLPEPAATIYSSGERAANSAALYRADKVKPLTTAPEALK